MWFCIYSSVSGNRTRITQGHTAKENIWTCALVYIVNIELQNGWSCQRPLGPSGPVCAQAVPPRAESPGICPGGFWRSPRRSHCLSGQPALFFSHLHTKKALPDVEREYPAFQLVHINFCPVTGHHWFCLLRTLSSRIYPEPFLIQAEWSQLSQPFLIDQVFQPLSFFWPFIGLSSVSPCLSCTIEPRSGHRAPCVASLILSGKITSIDLLVRCWLTEPGITLDFFVAMACLWRRDNTKYL